MIILKIERALEILSIVCSCEQPHQFRQSKDVYEMNDVYNSSPTSLCKSISDYLLLR
ncbi:MAG: hypothetical protein ACTS4V_00170 [Candidatus Hodgkinia cicadicola]